MDNEKLKRRFQVLIVGLLIVLIFCMVLYAGVVELQVVRGGNVINKENALIAAAAAAVLGIALYAIRQYQK